MKVISVVLGVLAVLLCADGVRRVIRNSRVITRDAERYPRLYDAVGA